MRIHESLPIYRYVPLYKWCMTPIKFTPHTYFDQIPVTLDKNFYFKIIYIQIQLDLY